MESKTISKSVKRAGKNMIILAVVLILTTAVIAFFGKRAYYNFFTGPFTADAKAFETIQDPEKEWIMYYKVTVEKVLDTGFSIITTEKSKTGTVISEKETSRFYAGTFSGRYVLIETEPKNEKTEYTGVLKPVSDDLKKQFLDDPKYAKAKKYFYPFVLSTTQVGDFKGWCIAGIVLAIILLPLAVFYIIRGTALMNNPELHKAYKNILASPNAGKTLKSIDDCFEAKKCVKLAGVMVSDTWLIRETMLDTAIAATQDVMWAHKIITSHKQMFITVSKTTTVNIYFRNGTVWEGISVSNDDLLNAVLTAAPWAIGGYTDQIKQAWTADRVNFIAVVDGRRKKILEGPQEPAAPAQPQQDQLPDSNPA